MTASAVAVAQASGPVLFARYAQPPNRLGLCGPDGAPAALAGAADADERELRDLAAGFEGAWPYLQLIASDGGIGDPLDRAVVESYWLGGGLADRVRPRAFHRDLTTRFRPRATAADWRVLESSLEAGAHPMHAFHVLEVYPRVGLLRGGGPGSMIETIDACRIRWGRVEAILDDRLLVSSRPLVLRSGRLVLGEPRVEPVAAWRSRDGLLGGARKGDEVAVHWGWACDILSPGQRQRLVTATSAALARANERI